MTGDSEPPRRDESSRGPSFWLAIAFFIVALLIAIAAIAWLRDSSPPSPLRPGAASSPAPALADTVGVFVEPGDGRTPLLDEIESARTSIDVEIYILTDELILEALEEAQQRGVAVRVILEEHPFGGGGRQPEIFARLEDGGIAVRWNNPVFRFTHIKTMIVDGTVALIMNLNVAESAFTKNREFGIVTNEPDVVRAAAAVFEADWTRGPEPDLGPLTVSPTNARTELLGLVQGARRSLDVYAEVLRDPEMLGALMDAAERGVDVRVVISPSGDFEAERVELAAAGVEVRLLSRLYVHAKVIVADGEQAFVGSQNLSATSLDENRELGIIIDDPVGLARITRTFELDFRAGRPEELQTQ